MRYLADFIPGEVIRLGEFNVTQEEIIAFASKFDPQPFHVDPEAAKSSIFGGLIASGWHTCALWMRGFADVVLNNAHSLASPGGDELRWPKPVRPGDTLTASYEVLDVTASERNPSRGTVRGRGTMTNQKGEVVMSVLTRNHFTRKPTNG
jgi:acyl dehydratase